MGQTLKFPIVLNQTFIEATRDTGYRSTAAAIAELVDNALQASARNIRIFVRESPVSTDGDIEVSILDDGNGMDSMTLRKSLQFGGSMRFGDRSGLGRFGMGLPNASVSQARRIDVYSWKTPNACYSSHLDVNEIASGTLEEVPVVRKGTLPKWVTDYRGFSGTLVTWSQCDRLDNRRISTICRKLHEPLGRVFRYFLWDGVKIEINGERVIGIDPLFLNRSAPLSGAKQFGELLTFEIKIPGQTTKTSQVTVRFTELPVAKWHDMPVKDKRQHRIVDGAGLSILRARREVDYGWWFFGSKRRENYDSWWRGELSFDPELDELFSITHSKQGINPTQDIRAILTPDLEAVARQLNGRVQDAFASIKVLPSANILADTRDSKAEIPPSTSSSKATGAFASSGHPDAKSKTLATESSQKLVVEEETAIILAPLPSNKLFEVKQSKKELQLTLNSNHPFIRSTYIPAKQPIKQNLEYLFISFAKAHIAQPESNRHSANRLCTSWAAELAAMLGEPA